MQATFGRSLNEVFSYVHQHCGASAISKCFVQVHIYTYPGTYFTPGFQFLAASMFWSFHCHCTYTNSSAVYIREHEQELFIHSVPDELLRLLCILKMRLNTKSKTNRTLQNSEREDYLLYCWIDLVPIQRKLSLLGYMFSYFNLRSR